jgi:cytochrome b-561 domain-containing protein 2
MFAQAARVSVSSYFLLVVYRTVTLPELNMFALHPLVMASAFTAMVFAVFSLKRHQSLETIKKQGEESYPKSVRNHYILMFSALTLLTVGNMPAYFTKEELGKDHFTSWHAWVGITAFVLFLYTQFFVGYLLQYTPNFQVLTDFAQQWRLKYFKGIHAIWGNLIVALFACAIFLSSSSKWIRANDQEWFYYAYMTSLVTTGVCVLANMK